MSFRILIGVLLFLVTAQLSSAQQVPANINVPKHKMHGTFYVFWGYNRDVYSHSTIRFKNTTTDNYDFKFINARAKDKPNMDEFYKFKSLTIPQYNLHGGYLFNDKRNLGIEISWDHLKYVVVDNQVIHVKGQIRGRYIDKDTLVTPNFVHLQHTNGNNYLMASLVKKYSLYKKRNAEISLLAKAGAGPMISYTISTVLGNYDKGYFHYHGMVAAIGTDLRIDIYRHFFIQASGQGAFADYTNTRLGADHQGISTQTFFSFEYFCGAGFNIPLTHN